MGILKLENVSYRYQDAPKDQYVFQNRNYEFEQGKMYAIKGKSGSGKTTLLSIITGLEKCTEGNVFYEEKNLKKMNLDRFRNTEIGIVFQSYNLLPRLTAMENIILSMEVSKVKVKNKKEKALELMKSVGLSEEHAKRKILKLSGGEQQRVAIARAIAKNPKLLLCDEPTGALDYNTGKQILQLLQDTCRKEKMTVIIITHNTAIAPMADKVIYFKNGTAENIKINENTMPIENIEW